MTDSSLPRSAGARVAELAAAGTVLGASCLALNGFPRYDVPQLAVATFFAAALTIAWAAAVFRGRVERAPAGLAPLVAWLLLLVWAAGSAALQSHGAAWDTVAYLFLPAPFVAIACAPIEGARVRGGALAGLGAAVLLAATASVLQVAGLSFPAPIPAISHDGSGAEALFDTAMGAGAWFAGAAALFAVLAARGERPPAALAALAGVAGLGVGLAGQPVALVIAAAALAGIAASPRRAAWLRASAPAWGALLVAAAIGLALAPPAPPSERLADFVRDVPGELRSGQPVHWGDAEARRAWSAAALNAAPRAQPFGAGAGGFASPALEALDTDAPYALAHTDGLPEPRYAPSALLTWTVELGVLAPLMVLLALALIGWRRRTSAGVALAMAGAAALMVTGGVTAALAVLVGVAITLTADAEDEATTALPGTAPLLVVGLTCLALVAVATQARALAWGHHHAYAVNLVANRQPERALEEFLAANEAQERYESTVNAAIAAARVTSEAPFDEAVARPLQRAVEIAPAAPIPRFSLADQFVRRTADSIEEGPARSQLASRMLETVLRVDPNFAAAYVTRADLLITLADVSGSVRALAAGAERPLAPDTRAGLLELLGDRYAEYAQQPAEAAVAYREALDLASDPGREGILLGKLAHVEEWSESGVRPTGGHDHGEHDDDAHDHDHDHGEHDAQRSAGDGSGGPDPGDAPGERHDHEDHDHGDGHEHEGRDHEGHDHD